MSNTNLALNIRTEGVFNPVYKPYLRLLKRTQIYYGGSSSGKSVFLSDRCVLDVLKGRNYLICRKTGNTLRKSTFNEICKSIRKFRVSHLFNINKSEMVITCTVNRSQIMFVGLDDVEKVKSITPEEGVITDIWVEEATETERKDVKQLQKRLRGRSKFPKRLHISFNPILKSHWIYIEWFKDLWIEGETHAETENLSILKTTYLDNEFLTDDDKEALNDETDPYYHNVYTLGNWGVLGHVIYKNWEIKEFDETDFRKDNYRNGVDWGFSDHPFAFTRLYYNREKSTLHVCEEIYETNLLNKESAKAVKKIIGNGLVTCDGAEPKSVSEYIALGVNAQRAKKGPGSVEYGIKFVQSLKIIIHPRCQATINEIQVYQYMQDKFGDALPKPIKKNDNIMDAIRYALEEDSHYEIPTPKERMSERTLENFKNKDMFDKDYEEWEDELGIEYGNGYIICDDDDYEQFDGVCY